MPWKCAGGRGGSLRPDAWTSGDVALPGASCSAVMTSGRPAMYLAWTGATSPARFRQPEGVQLASSTISGCPSGSPPNQPLVPAQQHVRCDQPTHSQGLLGLGRPDEHSAGRPHRPAPSVRTTRLMRRCASRSGSDPGACQCMNAAGPKRAARELRSYPMRTWVHHIGHCMSRTRNSTPPGSGIPSRSFQGSSTT